MRCTPRQERKSEETTTVPTNTRNSIDGRNNSHARTRFTTCSARRTAVREAAASSTALRRAAGNQTVSSMMRTIARATIAGGIHALPRDDRPVLHGDDGATLKATTVLAMLWWLGVKPSYSRPRVSDDNAFVESLFRTAKYRPEFPDKGFADLGAAREWAREFVHWYNHDHRHSGIRYVSPAQRHDGTDVAILAARHDVYLKARQRNPARWSGNTRDWSHIEVVTLNPERDSVVAATRPSKDT